MNTDIFFKLWSTTMLGSVILLMADFGIEALLLQRGPSIFTAGLLVILIGGLLVGLIKTIIEIWR